MSKTDEILKSLTIDEKIRLLNGVGNWNTFDAGKKLPVVSMSDGPHGLRHQTENTTNINDSNRATCFPTASAIACSWNPEATKKTGRAIAYEAKAEDVQIILGCGMNINLDCNTIIILLLLTTICGNNEHHFGNGGCH